MGWSLFWAQLTAVKLPEVEGPIGLGEAEQQTLRLVLLGVVACSCPIRWGPSAFSSAKAMEPLETPQRPRS